MVRLNTPFTDTKGLNVELSTINRLYLELSQITTAKTSRDLELDYQRIISQRRGKLIQDIYNCDEAELLPSDLKIRMNDEIMCYNMQAEHKRPEHASLES
jgi:hypothetical protein